MNNPRLTLMFVRCFYSSHGRQEAETALLPAPFWCTSRVESAHFDWRWRERPALALLVWETFVAIRC